MATLYVVATPIGNLSDMTPRAIEVLKSVSLIAAEDTRVTGKLCHVFHIDTPLTACHQHNEEGKGRQIAKRMLEENIDVALTTDAGTPGISDPGYGLTRACVALEIPVIAIPGACAMAAALSVSGMDTREFAFYGFLPREKKDLKLKLKEMAAGIKVAVAHESPFRVKELLETLHELFPEAVVSVSCDLTKLHELTLRGKVGDVLEKIKANPKAEKGEYAIVMDFSMLAVHEERPPPSLSLEAELVEQLLQGHDMRTAQKNLVDLGRKKNAVYQAALKIKELFGA